MPAARALLPETAPETWTKPTAQNTHNGKTYRPTHPGLLRVEFSQRGTEKDAKNGNGEGEISGKGNGRDESESAAMEEGFASRLTAERDFAPHELITRLKNICLAAEKAYSSVQFGSGPRDHFELNSDLLFMNHSCAPTAFLVLPHLRPDEWTLHAGPNGLRIGEDVTFFYPSTEWDMAQGFRCTCGSASCLGMVRGARYVVLAELERRSYISEHIVAMKAAQQQNGE